MQIGILPEKRDHQSTNICFFLAFAIQPQRVHISFQIQIVFFTDGRSGNININGE
jgi:hypothetical protein